MEAGLSRREHEVMVLIIQGRTSKEIARLLGLSVLTVRKHRENLLRRLGLHSTAQLIALALGS
ncbi:helix-turn-helix transcriptional regulator [Janthinobacterium sp. HH107]|uniref:response regulator transcription factor n=1 Tax=Janthinobacterium sp. HH107 TaxID=1537279 RepID=UPI0021086342|nr:helix-turn-helix transcriptional regulator [Janthinobacterium sp. HH107]